MILLLLTVKAKQRRTKPVTNSDSKTRKWLLPLGIAAIAIGSAVVVSCFHSDDPATNTSGDDVYLPEEPAPITVSG